MKEEIKINNHLNILMPLFNSKMLQSSHISPGVRAIRPHGRGNWI